MTGATETADVVIIGGGVMGCSIACNLALTAADHGLRRIVLLERDTLGSGSTGRSSGAVRMHYSTAVNAELAWRSLHIFRNFEGMIGGSAGTLAPVTWSSPARRTCRPSGPTSPRSSRWA